MSGLEAGNADPGEQSASPEESINPGDCQAGLTDELEPTEATVDSDTIEVDDTASDVIDAEPRRSGRTRMLPERFRAYVTTEGIDILKSYKAAISDLHH